MKYIIDVPDNTTWIQVSTDRLIPYTEPDRKVIEDEVWKFAKKIASFNGLAKQELDECFGHTTIQGVMTTYDTYQEAKEKYEAWGDKIRVGDEVIDKDVGKAIVINIDFESCSILWLDGSVSEDVPLKDLHKTGRHFNEVEEMLNKMKEQ